MIEASANCCHFVEDANCPVGLRCGSRAPVVGCFVQTEVRVRSETKWLDSSEVMLEVLR